MAYIQEYFDFVNQAIELEFLSHTGLSMFELGNQRIIGPIDGVYTGKQYFQNRGMTHHSIDLNGWDGALPLDLTQPELFYHFHNEFDVLTNLGTTEHVEPIEKQYECFSILHNVVKPGGIMIHLVPNLRELEISGAWVGHCTIYYTDEFFLALAEQCNYTILENKKICGMNAVVYRKETATPFTTNKEIFKHIRLVNGKNIHST